MHWALQSKNHCPHQAVDIKNTELSSTFVNLSSLQSSMRTSGKTCGHTRLANAQAALPLPTVHGRLR